MIVSFEQMLEKAKQGEPMVLAGAAAQDVDTIKAMAAAEEAGMIRPVLVGDIPTIERVMKEEGVTFRDAQLVQADDMTEACAKAVELVRLGKADFLMKGKIMTGNLLKGVLSPDADLRTGSLMSHVMLFEVPGYHKLLGVTDGGMCTYPDLEKKVGIVKNAVRFFHKIGVEKPNVAALCAIETINPKMQETVDGAELKRMSLAGELGECYVEGPISYDLAMVPELSAVKGYTACPCCGDFDILLVPEIVVGNVLGKCLTYTCGGRMAGIVMGCKVPIVLTSRGSSAEEKYYSLAMGAGFVG